MTKDLNISQEQLEKALSDQGVTTPSGRAAAQIAAGVWHNLRRIETEGLLGAARDSYEKKQWQRAADHYAALDSELGEGAPLPGIWGRNDPYEELGLSLGTVKVPHPDGDLIVHGTVTGSFGPEAPPGPEPAGHYHTTALFGMDAAGLRRHLADTHHIAAPAVAGIGTLRETHKNEHSGMKARREPARPLASMPAGGPRPHAWDDITADLGALQAHLGRVHHIEHEGRSMDGLRAVHNGLHGVDDCGRRLGVSAPGPHAFTEFRDDPLGDAVRWHLENVHEISGHGKTSQRLKLMHLHEHERSDRAAAVPAPDPAGVTMDVRGAMSMLVELSRLSSDSVHRALGLLSDDERGRLRAFIAAPGKAAEHEH